MLFQADSTMEDAVKFSRFDSDNPLSTCSSHPILLEEKNWLTCEHYYNAKITLSPALVATIEKATSGQAAFELTKPWYRWKHKDWKRQRAVLMTRALYTKVQMYDEVREALFSTGNDKIIETSLYDYYWGVGRDGRGENQLGMIWMDIRHKLREKMDGE